MFLGPSKDSLVVVMILLMNKFFNLFLKGRGHWTVNYTGIQSFKIYSPIPGSKTFGTFIKS